MAMFDYQFASVDQLLGARDAMAAIANDWQGRILTSIAAANGAGFVTILTNIATKGFSRWLIWTLSAAAVFFMVGLVFATGALFQLHHRYDLKASSLHQEMQSEWLRKRAKDASAQDAANINSFLEMGAPNRQNFATALQSAEQSMGDWATKAFAMFVVGLTVTFLAVVGWALAAAPISEKKIATHDDRRHGRWRWPRHR